MKFDSKIFLVIGIALIFTGIAFFFMEGKLTKQTVTGQFISTNDCMGIVQGVVVTDYGNSTDSMCDNSKKYNGKVVEVTGYIYEHDCKEGEGCFEAPYMKDIEEIRLVY